MKKLAMQLEITNSVNDNSSLEWFFCDTKKEKDEWIAKKEKERNAWTKKAGVVSTRYYSFQEYKTSTLLELDISELKGIKLKDIIMIIKSSLM